ncbi:ATP-grasp domain-containing protein [Anatilimnocola floriformis]|uniref:ATP-grasp domain-containing protein n=1 Tax=Anatilimnocola floriformis TaxID=2948575 RepID=UPI0020C23956|nr:ATP-grasp domain-containing protein [Anatilimnocola floriformis]
MLHGGLVDRGVRLVTTPEQFEQTQLFGQFFPRIRDISLPAVTSTSLDPSEVRRQASAMSAPPYFLKDYVKSAKEIWPRGCVVPRPGTLKQFAQTIAELREYRADRFETGLVVRPLVRLRSLGLDPFGEECCEEYRMIFLCGKRVFSEPYGYYGGSFTDFARFDKLGECFSSPFFMADCAVTESGECFLLETGDGGCCGLPPGLDCRDFYRSLAERFG